MGFEPAICVRCDGRFKNVRKFRAHKCPAKNQTGPSVYDRAAQRFTKEQKARRLKGLSPLPAMLRL